MVVQSNVWIIYVWPYTFTSIKLRPFKFANNICHGRSQPMVTKAFFFSKCVHGLWIIQGRTRSFMPFMFQVKKVMFHFDLTQDDILRRNSWSSLFISLFSFYASTQLKIDQPSQAGPGPSQDPNFFLDIWNFSCPKWAGTGVTLRCVVLTEDLYEVIKQKWFQSVNYWNAVSTGLKFKVHCLVKT